MNIAATEYTREDGLQAMVYSRKQGRWVVRKTDGRAWFYRPKSRSWTLCHALSSGDIEQDYCMSKDEALAILVELEPLK